MEIDQNNKEEVMIRELAARIEADMFAALSGPPQKRRQTALRVHGTKFETVELDDAGNIIEPFRCHCGPVMHWAPCPLAYGVT